MRAVERHTVDVAYTTEGERQPFCSCGWAGEAYPADKAQAAWDVAAEHRYGKASS